MLGADTAIAVAAILGGLFSGALAATGLWLVDRWRRRRGWLMERHRECERGERLCPQHYEERYGRD